MLISTAYAQSAGGVASSDMLIQLAPLVLIFIVFYFLLIRPQQRKLKEHRDMVEAVRRGDTVVTSGGIIGKVAKVDDAELTVEIADGVRVRVVRSTISDVRGKGQPLPAKTPRGSGSEPAVVDAPEDKSAKGK
jgi:preprotein translocase subunit YajC